MLLLILLEGLAVGCCCFFIGRFFERRNCKRHKTFDAGQQVSQIKNGLDALLRAYGRGLISEREYMDKCDRLIDQLLDLLHRGDISFPDLSGR